MWNHLRRAGCAVAVTLSGWLLAPDASAFCRTTTCDPNRGETCKLNDDGCVRDGRTIHWPSLPIVYRFHSEGSKKLKNTPMRAAVRAAFDAWENVQCKSGRTSVKFEEGPEIEDDKPVGSDTAPEKFGIYFRDEKWPYDNKDESLALTNQKYGKTSGTIEYADIEVNTADTKFRLSDEEEGVDFQAVMMHEVGHYLGLAHSKDPDSIMVASYCENQDRCGESTDRARLLSADDRNAVCAGYGPVVATAVPGSSCSQSVYPSVGAIANGAAILFLSATVIRRRRRSALR